jgi:glycosyltransferase involved in cell wall biosynthesis
VHIAFLSTEYPPHRGGGIGTSVCNLARALVAEGHRVTVVGWGGELETEDEGVRVRFLGETRVPRAGWLLNRRRAQRELQRLSRQEGLDVVEAHDWCGPSAGLRLTVPVVVRCHGSATYFGYLLGEPVRRSVGLAEGMALRGADAIAAVSGFAGETTRSLFGLRRPARVIPNGVDLKRFRPAAPGEVEDGLVLCFGTLVRKKGVLDLGPLFSRVLRRVPGARLRVIGRDARDRRTGSPSTWSLLEASLAPEARARTEYVGPLPQDALQEQVRKAAVCVFPSYAEALPLAWLEAMACGRPIAAYDIGWAPEIVDSGVDGVLVSPGRVEALADAVASLLEDQPGNLALGAAARRKAESCFAAGDVARATAEWYRAVLDGGHAEERHG